MFTHARTQRGITIVEVIIGVAVAGLVIVFISHTITLFVQASEAALDKTQALYLAEEGTEILRYLRDADWDTIENDLVVGTTYYFDVATTTLATTTAPEVIGKYTRSFELAAVERDSDDDIVDSGGTVDDGSRFATVSVSWGSESVELTALLTDLQL